VLRVAFVGRKGGVGKTSLTVSVADELVQRGMSVLVIDMDPQANLTAWVGGAEPDSLTMNDALFAAGTDGALDDVVRPSSWPGVSVAGAEERLAEREADNVPARELRLRRLLRTADLGPYDAVLVDSPPSLGLLMLNALNAVDTAVVVTDSERGGMAGVARVLEAIDVVAEESNPGLRVAGIVMNLSDMRVAEHQARWVELQEIHGDLVLGRLPKRAAVGTAYGASVPPRKLDGSLPFVMALSDVVDSLVKENAP